MCIRFFESDYTNYEIDLFFQKIFRLICTLITLLRVPDLGQIGSTKLVLPKWHKYGTLNRVIRVMHIIIKSYIDDFFHAKSTKKLIIILDRTEKL